jgi:tRNA modification GTPase
MDRQTIAALSTVPGRSAIAVIRISGPAALACLAHLGVTAPVARRASRATLALATGGRIDDAIVLWFPGPNSFTGEDVAELQVHGSRAVVRRILEALVALPRVRLAEPGEFTRRAIDAGKMDLVGAEALGDLIDSDTEQQRLQAMRALGGGLREKVEQLRAELLACAAILAAALDFSDEDDVPTVILGDIRTRLDQIARQITDLVQRAKSAEIIRDGFRIVLLGPPNAGKSSLLNALAQREAAIVSSIPGTTRDRIELSLDLDGFAVTLIDTAGLRESVDDIEQLGMARSLEAAEECHLALWLQPADLPSSTPPGLVLDKVLLLRSKADLGGGRDEPGGDVVSVSVVEPSGLDGLMSAIRGQLSALSADGSVVVSRIRQRRALEEALAAARRAGDVSDAFPELVAEELRVSVRAMESLLGRVDVDDVLDAVFSRFCIGK